MSQRSSQFTAMPCSSASEKLNGYVMSAAVAPPVVAVAPLVSVVEPEEVGAAVGAAVVAAVDVGAVVAATARSRTR